MLHFLQIENKTLHKQKDYHSLYCGSLEPNPQYLRGTYREYNTRKEITGILKLYSYPNLSFNTRETETQSNKMTCHSHTIS